MFNEWDLLSNNLNKSNFPHERTYTFKNKMKESQSIPAIAVSLTTSLVVAPYLFMKGR